ncbi:Uncharacterised protein [Citrobacter portucalensis]|nr:Uncharacterised protein [Citrobacter portucalensis]
MRTVLQPPPLLQSGAGTVYHPGSDWAGGGMESLYVSVKSGDIYGSAGLNVLPFPPVLAPSMSNSTSELNNRAAQALTKWWSNTFNKGDAKCLPATPANIRMVVADSPLMTLQQNVSVSAIAAYTEMLENGSVPPPVEMDKDVIVEGNHRMVAGLLCDTFPPVTPGTRPLTVPIYPFSQINPDIDDWENR